ncbi:MAG: FkbM family methyltransferase [Alphaproteobacteria bacterium]|nr:FkbM family methyltransferase [Alphaproteobacteria bacterium]
MAYKTVTLREHAFKLAGRTGDRYFDGLGPNGDRESAFLAKVVGRAVRPHSIAIDVGANIGLTTALLSTVIRNGAIHAFEPSSSAFPHLVETIAANAIANARPYRLALSDRDGSARFFDNPISAAASHLCADGTLGNTTETVAVTTLDALAAAKGIGPVDFIKIDVEGFEPEVLLGAQETIRRDKPGVFLEFNSFTLIAYGNRNPRTFLEWLIEHFPHVYRFANGELRRISGAHDMLDFLHSNLVDNRCVDDLYCCFEPL